MWSCADVPAAPEPTNRKHLAQPGARNCVTAFYTEFIALSITMYFWKKPALGVLTLVIASLSAFKLTFFFFSNAAHVDRNWGKVNFQSEN